MPDGVPIVVQVLVWTAIAPLALMSAALCIWLLKLILYMIFSMFDD
jgi:hypothetical protein